MLGESRLEAVRSLSFSGSWGTRRWFAGFGGRSLTEDALQTSWEQDRDIQAVRPKQVHGKVTKIAARNASDISPQDAGECDALVTAETGVGLTLRTADCLPILAIARGSRMAVGAAHAGWRGTRQEIAHSWILSLCESARALPENVWVFLGPAIRPCCYEVGEEFGGYFDPAFLDRAANGKRRLDLAAANRAGLERAGVPAHHIHDFGFCTHCADGRFHSYRKDRNEAGRNISWIYLIDQQVEN